MEKSRNGILVIRFVPLGGMHIVCVIFVGYDVSVNKI